MGIWREYVEELFDDTRPERYNLTDVTDGLPILKCEIEKVVFGMKDNKSLGPDGVHIEILKVMCESDPRFLDIL
ncbi:hypothetical protein HHI36_001240, partial [Cryptolaemus montrouzieri]